MRFVPTSCVREGMILGKDLYNNIGDLMLAKGIVLTAEYIKAIKNLKYNGIYIDDDISKDIPVINIISEKVRVDAIGAIKNIFTHVEKGNSIDIKHIEATMEQVKRIVDQLFNNKELMVNMVDIKVFDDYTYYHSVNVAVLSIILGIALGMKEEDLCNLGYAAIFHDIGKVFIDKDILNKPGSLTEEEYELIKSHSTFGYEYLKKGNKVPIESYVGVLDHHERYGGGGYPSGIKEDLISYFGRIIAVADAYDALTSDRPYREALLPSEAMEYVMGSVSTLFDPDIVKVFVRKIAPYPIGTCVRLSNGMVGIVVENYEDLCMRPLIRVFQDQGEEIEPYEIQLSDPHALCLTIVEVI